MIVSFINIDPDGLNTFAYSLAMAEYYNKQITFFMIDKRSLDINRHLNDIHPKLARCFKDAMNNNRIHFYDENMISSVGNDFHKIDNLEAVVFASGFVKKYGSLRLFQQVSNLPVPLMLIKVHTIFKPLGEIFNNIDLDHFNKHNKKLKDNLSENFDVNFDSNTEIIQKESKSKPYKAISSTEEIAANLLLELFHIRNKNQLITHKKMFSPALLTEVLSSNELKSLSQSNRNLN